MNIKFCNDQKAKERINNKNIFHQGMPEELYVTDMAGHVSLQMNLDDDLGIAIAGGIDTPAIPNDSSIVITNVAKGSIADGKLR